MLTIDKGDGARSQEYISETKEAAEWLKHEPLKYEDHI